MFYSSPVKQTERLWCITMCRIDFHWTLWWNSSSRSRIHESSPSRSASIKAILNRIWSNPRSPLLSPGAFWVQSPDNYSATDCRNVTVPSVINAHLIPLLSAGSNWSFKAELVNIKRVCCLDFNYNSVLFSYKYSSQEQSSSSKTRITEDPWLLLWDSTLMYVCKVFAEFYVNWC